MMHDIGQVVGDGIGAVFLYKQKTREGYSASSWMEVWRTGVPSSPLAVCIF